LKEIVEKYENLSEEHKTVVEAKREIVSEIELKSQLLKMSKSTSKDKKDRIILLLSAAVKRLKSELVFMKKSIETEIDESKKYIMTSLEKQLNKDEFR